MFPGVYGVLFGGKSEGIEPHRVQHIEATHTLKARIDIGCGVSERVSDMEPCSGGVWEHIEYVDLLASPIFGLKGAVSFPV